MENLLNVCKPVGVTPLQAINRIKEKFSEYKKEKISYAGRLDPMAEGLLILLVGEENKKRNQFENLDKEYEFEVLFGVGTDSYDILGIVDQWRSLEEKESERIKSDLTKKLSDLTGKQNQAFPPYSSKPVNGKPLYWWARQNRLSEIDIPERAINIKKLSYLDSYKISINDLKRIIINKIRLVEGDFRQEEISTSWKKFFEEDHQEEYLIMRFTTCVSSGTYIRSLAKRMGETNGTPSLAFSIKRTRVGDFNLQDCIKLD